MHYTFFTSLIENPSHPQVLNGKKPNYEFEGFIWKLEEQHNRDQGAGGSGDVEERAAVAAVASAEARSPFLRVYSLTHCSTGEAVSGFGHKRLRG